MKISTKGRYALIIMIDLAKNYKNNTYMPLKEISENENISLKYLEKIMMMLNKNDFLDVSRGNNGGYKLKKEPKEYNVGDILRLTEGDMTPISCITNNSFCKNKNNCKTFKFYDGLYDEINNYIDSKTLEDFM